MNADELVQTGENAASVATVPEVDFVMVQVTLLVGSVVLESVVVSVAESVSVLLPVKRLVAFTVYELTFVATVLPFNFQTRLIVFVVG